MDTGRLLGTVPHSPLVHSFHSANSLCSTSSTSVPPSTLQHSIYSTPTAAPPQRQHQLQMQSQRQQQHPVPTVAINPRIKVELENDSLWRKFHQHTTEMIVTKGGRRMFPTLRYRLSGLDPNATYAVFLELAPADDNRYKFQSGRWIVAGRAEPSPNGRTNSGTSQHQSFIDSLVAAGAIGASRSRLYGHPDSPAPGRIWTRQPLSFHRIKLTNNVAEPQSNLLLNSMHKYEPRVYVLRLHDYYPSVPQLVAAAAFPQTQFIAVTAYQNERVIQLKIDHNPFAKGFRDGGSGTGGGNAVAAAHAYKRHLPASFHMHSQPPQRHNFNLAAELSDEKQHAGEMFLPYETDDSFVEPPTKRAPPSPRREVSPLDISAVELHQQQQVQQQRHQLPMMHTALHAFGLGALQPPPRQAVEATKCSPKRTESLSVEKLSRSAEKSRKLAAFSALALASKDDSPTPSTSSGTSDSKSEVQQIQCAPTSPPFALGPHQNWQWSLAAQFWLAAAAAAQRSQPHNSAAAAFQHSGAILGSSLPQVGAAVNLAGLESV